MKPAVFLVLFGLLALPAMAAEFATRPGSTLGFTATFQGEEFEGTFKDFEAKIRFDPDDLAASKFDVSIDLASVATGDKDRDDVLPGSEFFNTGKFPKAHFVTTEIHRSGDAIVAEGTLSLKGVDKPVTLAVTYKPAADGASLDVQTTLNRLDFNVGTGDYADTSTIGNEVQVKAHLLLGSQ
jgi:polyisoprenoid-binding protein YceI